MAGRATTPQGRKLGNINNMPNRKYLPSINFSVPFARWSHFYVSIDWTMSHILFVKKSEQMSIWFDFCELKFNTISIVRAY
jgi:hypothetical protein